MPGVRICFLLALTLPAIVTSLHVNTIGGADDDPDLPRNDLARQLAYLSADSSDKGKVYTNWLETLGWFRHKRLEVKPREGGTDSSRVYLRDCVKKDGSGDKINGTDLFGYGAKSQDPLEGLEGRRCGYCAFVFSYTDDDEDWVNDFDRVETDFCGMKGVHRGFVREAMGYIEHRRMPFILGQLTDANCARTVFAGHSLGGSVANLVAFCANNHDRPPGYHMFDQLERKNVMLVTFGAPATSKHPMYNTHPCKPFDGQRYVVSQKKLKAISIKFGTDAVLMVAKIMKGSKEKSHSRKLYQKYKELEALKSEGKSRQWRKEMESVTERYGHIEPEAVYLAKVAGEEDNKLWKEIRRFLVEHKADLSFEHDPVPAMNIASSFVHPEIALNTLVHPRGLGEPPVDGPSEDVEYVETSVWEPAVSPFRNMFGILGATVEDGVSIPNHRLCCYIASIYPKDADDCHTHIKTDVACNSQKPSTYR